MILSIQFETPVIEGKAQGIYAIVFDEINAYIGSSKNLSRRFSDWKLNITANRSANSNMLAILPSCKRVRFEVIEIVENVSDLLIKEDYYIVFATDLGLYKNTINKRAATLNLGDGGYESCRANMRHIKPSL